MNGPPNAERHPEGGVGVDFAAGGTTIATVQRLTDNHTADALIATIKAWRIALSAVDSELAGLREALHFGDVTADEGLRAVRQLHAEIVAAIGSTP